MGIQLGLMEAQKRSLEADAAKKEADAKKTAGADTEYTRVHFPIILQQRLMQLNALAFKVLASFVVKNLRSKT